jgi:hypothetical protein
MSERDLCPCHWWEKNEKSFDLARLARANSKLVFTNFLALFFPDNAINIFIIGPENIINFYPCTYESKCVMTPTGH